jgi:sodium/proline symporter
MIVGAATVIFWSMAGLSETLYEMIPGFAASLLAIIVVSLLTAKPSREVEAQFEEFEKIVKE